MTVPAEADVFERSPVQPGIEPVGENTLIGAAELASTGEHTTAIDPHREAEGLPILQCKRLAGELGRAVKGDGRSGGEFLGDTSPAHARWQIAGGGRSKGISYHLDGQSCERRDRVDPTGAQEDKTGPVLFAVLEHVDCTAQIVLDQLAGTRFAVDAREHAGISRGVDHPVYGGQRFQVAGRCGSRHRPSSWTVSPPKPCTAIIHRPPSAAI